MGPILRGLLVALPSLAIGLEAAEAAALTVQVVDRAAMPVVDAVVYAVPAVPVAATKAAVMAEIAQEHLAFTPLVTVVETGGSVSFPNRDTVRHQVYSFSPAKVFELKLYAGLPATPVVFDKAGLVALGCNIHDRMVAYVLVVDTPFYGKTVAGGRVRLDGLPPGEYKVSVWSPRMSAQATPTPVAVTTDTSLDTIVDLKPAS